MPRLPRQSAPRLYAGLSTQAAVLNEDGTINGPAHPATVGSVISLFGTGVGQTNPPGVTGSPFPLVPAALQAHVSVLIGNAPAEVLYAGAAPGLFAGIDQINVRVPAPLDGTGDAVSVSVWSSLDTYTWWEPFVTSTISVH